MREFRGQVVANAVNEKILWHISQDNADYTKKFMSPKRAKKRVVVASLSLIPVITFVALVLLYG